LYSELDPERILNTIATLKSRIGERFPNSGLSRVSSELERLGIESQATTQRLRQPVWSLRIGAGIGVLGIAGIMVGVAMVALRISAPVEGRNEPLQASEAAINEIILLSIGIFFLLSLETRVKRRVALRALHKLRSLVHIIDMHQLTKDPERLFAASHVTASSPAVHFNRSELARYLDYCSELLSLASKLAALHVQYLNDPVVLSAVNDIETLVTGLSNKIWQKIMILDVVLPPAPAEQRITVQGEASQSAQSRA